MLDPDTFTTNSDFHGAKGLVFIGDSIVVIRRDTHTNSFPLHVDLPGGGREGNETPFETFSREVFEEIGLTIYPDDVVYSKKYQNISDPTRLGIYFVTRPQNVTEEDIVFGDEGLEYFIITPEAFIALPDAVPGQKMRTSDYLDFLKMHNTK